MQEENFEIPVVFTPDEHYIVPTCVAILSMLRTKASETKYKFYIIVSSKIDKRCLEYFERVNKIEKFDYQVMYINSDIFDQLKITIKHTTTSTYYRLNLPDILTNYDKCMYHDGDILVCKDLKEMFDIDLSDYYVAGVKSIVRQQETKENLKRMEEYGYPSFDDYISVGDIILNLSKMREDELINKFSQRMKKGYAWADADVINFCCYGKKYFLPLKFCMFNRWLSNNALSEMEKQIYTCTEIEEAKQSPAIIHFTGADTKPWRNLRTEFAEEWWEYARDILDEEEYEQWYSRAEETTIRRDWSYLKEKLKIYESVMIFGYSKISKKLFEVLKGWGHHIECFIDNDTTKQGQYYEGCEVLNVECALLKFKDTVIVNAGQNSSQEIRNQLTKLGIAADRVIDYVAKNETYYLSLAPQYYEYEFRDLCVREFGWK